jgi:hypothetical protein
MTLYMTETLRGLNTLQPTGAAEEKP